MAYVRSIAKKVPIDTLLRGEFVRSQERYEPSYVSFNGMRISRVHVVAKVTDKYVNEESDFIALTIDDGTGRIRVKLFGEDTRFAKDVDVGDLVRVIGMVRDDGERFINGEIVKKLEDENWKRLWEADVKRLAKVYMQETEEEKESEPQPEEIEV